MLKYKAVPSVRNGTWSTTSGWWLKPLGICPPIAEELVKVCLEGREEEDFIDGFPCTIQCTLHPGVPDADGFTSEMEISFTSWVVEALIGVFEFSRPEKGEGTLRK